MIEYSLIGEGDAPEYFYCNPVTGEITLLQSVRYTGRSVYVVSTSFLLFSTCILLLFGVKLQILTLSYQLTVRAQDHGVPPRHSDATLEVTVLRDKGNLTFSQDNYTTQVSENENIGTLILTVRASPGVSILSSTFTFSTIHCLRCTEAPSFSTVTAYNFLSS